MANSNIINAVFGSGICAVTTSAFRANYGMILRFSGIELPTAFECDFSNYDTSNNDSITAIGQNGEVQIPDQLWDSGLNIYAYVYLHPTDDSGVTVYTVTIPVLGRPNRTEETPTPHEQSVIEQAISALNDAVEQTAADVVAADASASAAAQSEANASASERAAAASASAALASQNAAESAQRSATESATNASESARNAANSAAQAAQSATNAQEYAEQAEQSAQSIEGDVERAESAAATATEKATEAASSASTASGKANEASASATAAAQSASSASTAAQNAASSATAAESSATDAEQAKTDAQDAQVAAEQAAQSVSGLSAQIAQNTADIAELVQSKAGALVDTATGSIASFVPDATVPTVKGLTVDVEPVQDLHGYDSPWPAGGGKNLIDINSIVVGNTSNWSVDVNGDTLTVTHKTSYTSGTPTFVFNQPSGTYVISIGSINVTGQVSLYVNGSWAKTINNGNTFTIDAANTNEIKFSAQENQSTIITKIQIESGNTATSYAPYSNICPISGWDEVNITRSGANLLPTYTESFERDGLTYTVATDGSVTVNGTATQTTTYYGPKSTWKWDGVQDVWLSGCPTGGNYMNGYSLRVDPIFSGYSAPDIGNGVRLSGFNSQYNLANTPLKFCIVVRANTVCNNLVFRPMLNYGLSALPYTPYTAINTYTIQMPTEAGTVYGGTVDAVNGVLTVDRAMFTFTGAESFIKNTAWGAYAKLYNTGVSIMSSVMNNRTISSHFERSSGGGWSSLAPGLFMTAGRTYIGIGFDGTISDLQEYLADQYANNQPVQVVAVLATPITISLTPLEVSVLIGQTNNIWADSGDVSVEYAADLKTYIDQKIAAAVAALS